MAEQIVQLNSLLFRLARAKVATIAFYYSRAALLAITLLAIASPGSLRADGFMGIEGEKIDIYINCSELIKEPTGVRRKIIRGLKIDYTDPPSGGVSQIFILDRRGCIASFYGELLSIIKPERNVSFVSGESVMSSNFPITHPIPVGDFRNRIYSAAKSKCRKSNSTSRYEPEWSPNAACSGKYLRDTLRRASIITFRTSKLNSCTSGDIEVISFDGNLVQIGTRCNDRGSLEVKTVFVGEMQ
jgi:hypothetical protein